MARSLTHGLDIPDRSKDKKASKGGGNDGMKLGLAVAAIVVAGLTLAWYFDLFKAGPKAADAQGNAPGHVVTPEQKAEQQKQEKLLQLPEKDPHRPVQASG